MPKKAKTDAPYASFTVKFFNNKVEVDMNHFEKISPGKIQRTYPLIMDEWNRQQGIVLLEQRQRQRNKESEAAQSQEMEKVDG